MFCKSESTTKDNFLEQTKAAREERAFEKRRESAATCIQSYVRAWLTRRTYVANILSQFDSIINEEAEEPRSALTVYNHTRRFLSVWNKDRDKERFAKLCRYLTSTLDSESPKCSYVGVAFNKEHSITWISHMRRILWTCGAYLEVLKPEFTSDMKLVLLFLHTLVSFTAISTWNVLKGKNMDKLHPGMNQPCANLMGFLLQNDFYGILKGLGRVGEDCVEARQFPTRS